MDQLPIDDLHAEATGAGPPVVITHEGLAHSEAWDAQVAAWSADHRVARWDRRGCGRSPRPTGGYPSVDDLAAVARAASDVPAALVGCSFGSMVTLHCALEHPTPRTRSTSRTGAASTRGSSQRPGATRVVLPGSGHLPHLEVPDAFNRVVLEFLA